LCVAIPTFRRPQQLERLLEQIAVLSIPAEYSLDVLVMDNDPAQSAQTLVERLIARLPVSLAYASVKQPGLSSVRNFALQHAQQSFEFLAMIDDDEWPAPEWLDEFLRVQKQTGADALQGTIKRVFEKDPGGWTVHCDGVSDAAAPTGPIAMLQGAGNLLVRRDCLERLQAPWFDPAFGATGGEDADFLVRIKAQGARFAWAHEALAYDRVPPSRANLKWALKRAYSTGNSDMRVFLKHRPSRSAKIEQGARIVGALLLSPPLFLLLMADRNRRVKPLRKLYRAFGKIAAIGGRHYNEYSVIHGR